MSGVLAIGIGGTIRLVEFAADTGVRIIRLLEP
jgi:hypothetical protein